MNMTFTDRGNHRAARPFISFNFGSASSSRSREQHREPRYDLPTSRFHPDWFAIRIWEDDGGGHAIVERRSRT